MPTVLKTENDYYAEQYTLRVKGKRDAKSNVTPQSTLYARKKTTKSNKENKKNKEREQELA